MRVLLICTTFVFVGSCTPSSTMRAGRQARPSPAPSSKPSALPAAASSQPATQGAGASIPTTADAEDRGAPKADFDPLTSNDCHSTAPLAIVRWPASRSAQRLWFGARKLADVRSTRDRPVEVCGPFGEDLWLVQATCPGGSHPFSDLDKAHASRTGHIGEGGRCDKPIDRFVVQCPKRKYVVFMDMYHCTDDDERQIDCVLARVRRGYPDLLGCGIEVILH